MGILTRRALLGDGLTAVAGAFTAGTATALAGQIEQTPTKSWESQPTLKAIRYDVEVPDTLDLADRAKLAINAMIGEIEPKFNHECWWLLSVLPPSVTPHTNQWFDQNPRNLWALALLRIITGSDQGLTLEEKMKESVFSRMQDGLYFNAPFDAPGAWWRSGGACRKKFSTKEDFTNPSGMAVLLYAMIARYLRDHQPAIRERGQQLADALSRIAIRKDDYAYYPATSEFGAEYSYFRRSGWPDTKEALSDQDDPEGAVTCYHSLVVGALSRWYAATGDGKALETARKLVKYMLKPRFWTGGCSPWTDTGGTKEHNARELRSVHGGAERKPAALFQGHQAGMAYTFTGLIDYALVANDAYVKEWVRQGYEYFRNLGLHRIGMWGENIANNQMVEVAIKLADAGAGDYWDDVDECVRNTVVEDQYVDMELLAKEAKRLGLPTRQLTQYGEFSTERLLGCLRHGGLIDGQGTMDPTSNGVKGSSPYGNLPLYGSCYLEPLYFVWEAITRYRNGVAQVNLLLNRASAWLDVDSYLPYEGKVVVRNKTCNSIYVRIPKWVDRKAIACTINGAKSGFSWAGNYLILVGLRGQETVGIEFPMVETVETYYLLTRDVGPKWWEHADKLPTYVLHMKGSTCVKVEFPNRDKFTQLEPVYPVFQRDRFRANKAPMKTTTRYVHPTVVSW